MTYFDISLAQYSCYDGDGDDPPADPPVKIEFTPEQQEKVNALLAEQKRKANETFTKLEQQNQALLKNQNLSKEERARLEENLENVQKQLRSKEQSLQHEKKQLEDRYLEEIQQLKSTNEQITSKYHDSIVTRSLKDAAISGEAFNANQIVNLLKPYIKMVNESPMVDFPDRNAETGEEMITQMTPDEAVKRMKQIPEAWGNLFKSNVVSGIGGGSDTGGLTPGANGRVDARKLSPEQYRKMRKDNPSALGLKPNT